MTEDAPRLALPGTQASPMTVRPPGNQTHVHWWLTWRARRYLYDAHAIAVGPEVSIAEEWPLFPDEAHLAQYTTWTVCIVDLLAVMELYHALSRTAMPLVSATGRELVIVAVEAKASRSDFRSGFNDDVADFNYVVCPKDLVKVQELPAHVGLFVCEKDGIIMRRRAKRIEKPRLSPERAIKNIAAACCLEISRMQPAIANPFLEQE